MFWRGEGRFWRLEKLPANFFFVAKSWQGEFFELARFLCNCVKVLAIIRIWSLYIVFIPPKSCSAKSSGTLTRVDDQAEQEA